MIKKKKKKHTVDKFYD